MSRRRSNELLVLGHNKPVRMGNYADFVREAVVLFVAVAEEDAWAWDVQCSLVANGCAHGTHGTHGTADAIVPTLQVPVPLAKAVSGSCCPHSSTLPEWSHRSSNYGTSQNVEGQPGESER
ncbi:hypothetical protein TrVFT333_003219 [Trichoderma virens FT-333]|nr:hypothetical protein TrVFT333_003219 [Trichoderma virens FT-333]